MSEANYSIVINHEGAMIRDRDIDQLEGVDIEVEGVATQRGKTTIHVVYDGRIEDLRSLLTDMLDSFKVKRLCHEQ